MNVIRAEVVEIQSEESLALVHCSAQSEHFCALILDYENMQNLIVGARIELIFKEAEVMIASVDSCVSARNSFVGEIKSITHGTLLSEIEFDFHGIPVFSIITRQSAERLALSAGKNARWLIKANEISIRTV